MSNLPPEFDDFFTSLLASAPQSAVVPSRVPEPESSLLDDLYFSLSLDRHTRKTVEEDSFNKKVGALSALPLEFSVIEVACGTGHNAHATAKFTARKVVGIDLSERSVREAQKRYHGQDNLKFQAGDVYRLAETGIQNAAVVSCIQSLHHFNNLDAALDGMLSVMHPDGTLFVQDFDREESYKRFFNDSEHKASFLKVEEILRKPKEQQVDSLKRQDLISHSLILTYLSSLAAYTAEEVAAALERKGYVPHYAKNVNMTFGLFAARPHIHPPVKTPLDLLSVKNQRLRQV